MRLIDADKVKIDSRKHCIDCTLNGTKQCKTCIINLICDRLDLQPTVTPKWYKCLEQDHTLKARSNKFIAYNVKYLIDNLDRELRILIQLRGDDNG